MTLATQLCILIYLHTGGSGAVIDASTDFKRVELPDDWKGECLNPLTGLLRMGLEPKKRAACVNTAFNNRLLKKRSVVKK